MNIQFPKHLILLTLNAFFFSCTNINQMERGLLSDPMMQPKGQTISDQLDTENFPRREGSSNQGNVAGGGCGC